MLLFGKIGLVVNPLALCGSKEKEPKLELLWNPESSSEARRLDWARVGNRSRRLSVSADTDTIYFWSTSLCPNICQIETFPHGICRYNLQVDYHADFSNFYRAFHPSAPNFFHVSPSLNGVGGKIRVRMSLDDSSRVNMKGRRGSPWQKLYLVLEESISWVFPRRWVYLHISAGHIGYDPYRICSRSDILLYLYLYLIYRNLICRYRYR